MVLCSHAATSVVAWGSGTLGQTNVPSGLSNVVAIASHGDHSLALHSDGTVVAWGNNYSGQTNPPLDLRFKAIAAGVSDSVGLQSNGTVVVWGSNGSGEEAVPPGLDHVVGIGAGMFHNLAIRQDGTAVGWGYDYDQQTDVPKSLNRVVSVAAGEYHSIALRSDGTVAAWGDNEFGQGSVPAGLNDIVAIAAGTFHNLALRADGTVKAWGRNDLGACDVPAGLTNVVSVAAGDNYSLALKADGTLAFWGYDYFHLSYGTNGLSNVVAIAAGVSHCVALINDGEPFVVRTSRDRIVYQGDRASLESIVLGEPIPSFQWMFQGTNVVNGTNSELVMESAQPGQAGSYSLVVSNAHGTLAVPDIRLTVLTNHGVPYIVSQPCDTRAVQGGNAILAVEAGGMGPFRYQWFFNHTNAIDGAVGEVLELTSVTPGLIGTYSVQISNSVGEVTSVDANLSLVKELAWVFHTGGYVFSSPAIGPDGRIYIGSADGKVYALNSQGKLSWFFSTGAEVQSSPAIAPNGTVYVGSGDGSLYALNYDGTQQWRFVTRNFVMSSPALGADGTIYINSRDGNLYAIGPDGQEQWHYSTDEYYNDMPPVIGPNGTIFMGTGGKVRAIGRDGQLRWVCSVAESGNISVVLGPKGSVYATSGGDGMKMVAFTHNGRMLWEFPFGSPTAMINPAYPAVGPDGTIYIAASDAFLYAINPDGSQRWKVPALRSQSSPALSKDGKIYLNSDWDFRARCYDRSGVLQWEYFLGGQGASGLMSSYPTLKHGVLYFGSGNGNVYALNAPGELADGGWPAFGRDVQHTGRDFQRGIDATNGDGTGREALKLVVEPSFSYRLQGSLDLTTWNDCTNFVSSSANVTIARPAGFSFFRLVSP